MVVVVVGEPLPPFASELFASSEENDKIALLP